MTSTAVLADIRSIPNEGLLYTAGDVEVKVVRTYGAGYVVQVRHAGVMQSDLCSQHNGEAQALTAWKTQVVAHPAVELAAPVRTLEAPAKGTATHMSPAEVQVIGEALTASGVIRRGRGFAAADIKSLQAMARRGFATLDHPIRPRSATVTDFGRQIHAELVAADNRRAAEIATLNSMLAA